MHVAYNLVCHSYVKCFLRIKFYPRDFVLLAFGKIYINVYLQYIQFVFLFTH
jgi:hypothetical protein